MAVHTISDLRQMQSLPLRAKIAMTENRVRLFYDRYDSYISFSGGKDSTVLLDITRKLYPDIPAVFIDTGLEYPEIREFVKTVPNVIWLNPIKYDKTKRAYKRTNFREVIQTYGYPIISKEQAQYIEQYRKTKSDYIKDIRINGNRWGQGKISKCHQKLIDAPFKISDKCCKIMKKNPAKIYEKQNDKYAIIATMAEESDQRLSNWLTYGCNAFDAERPNSRPMSFWTEQDVLQYLKEYNVPYASVYGDIVEDENGKLKTTGCHRTGCVFCGFGCHLEKEPNRFQRLKITHPKLWEYCMRPWDDGGLGMKQVLDFIDVKTE